MKQQLNYYNSQEYNHMVPQKKTFISNDCNLN